MDDLSYSHYCIDVFIHDKHCGEKNDSESESEHENQSEIESESEITVQACK